MNDEEANDAFARIAKMLRDTRLGWVTEQVEESVELGKTVTKKADASEFIDDFTGTRRGKQRMLDYTTTEAYSNVEQLYLLLDAIDRLAALPEFERDALAILQTQKVKFVPEHEKDPGHSLEVDQTEGQKDALSRLRAACAALRGLSA